MHLYLADLVVSREFIEKHMKIRQQQYIVGSDPSTAEFVSAISKASKDEVGEVLSLKDPSDIPLDEQVNRCDESTPSPISPSLLLTSFSDHMFMLSQLD